MLTRNKKRALIAAVVVLAAGPTMMAPTFSADELHSAEPGAGGQSSWEAVALGRVEPRSGEIRIAAAAPGRITDVPVKANEAVFAGELLVRLDDEDALARLTEADAQVALHKRARNDQPTPAAAADRRKAEDAAADAERAVADARSALDAATAEWRAGRVPQADLSAARSALARAQDRLTEQQAALAKLKAQSDTPLPTRFEGELNVARAQWTLAEAALEKTRVRAPIDGTVLEVEARKGELAPPSAEPALLVLGDVSDLRVRAEVDEQYLGRLHVGQRVTVRAGAFRGRDFAGKIAAIAGMVGPSRINARGARKFSDVDVLEVVVDLPNPGPLVVGEQVDVYFSADRSGEPETQ
jgi:HlyD family secretion protein